MVLSKHIQGNTSHVRQLRSQVVSHCKAFSAFKAEDAFSLLHTANQIVPKDANAFKPAPYDGDAPVDRVVQQCLGFQKHKDIVAHAGRELALRCCKSDPEATTKEASKEELIAPVVLAAATRAGVPN